ncbi:MAG: hypothetical protein M5U32_20445 [Myxococcota bacterium]|nr:hypothetical protein [Myxococcota bacterium]
MPSRSSSAVPAGCACRPKTITSAGFRRATSHPTDRPTSGCTNSKESLAGLREELAAAQQDLATLEESLETQRARDVEREALLQQLDEDNRVLRAGERWPFLIMGAAILGAGFIGGLLMRGGATRRSSSRIRF